MTRSAFFGGSTRSVRILFVFVAFLLVAGASIAEQSSNMASAPLLASPASSPIVLTTPFSKPVAYSSEGKGASSLYMADVNGDSIADLIALNYNSDGCETASTTEGTVSILLGNSDGTFKPAITYDSGGFCPTAVVVGDLNGDGHPDVIALNCDPIGQINCPSASVSNLGVLLGNGDGTFRAAVTYNSGGSGAVSVLLADFNGDGKLDVAVGEQNNNGGTIGILIGKGDGSFQAPVSYDLGFSSAAHAAVGDLNGDGKPDLITTGCITNGGVCERAMVVLSGNGDGTFQSVVSNDLVPQGRIAIVGDLNGDGHADLVFASEFAHPPRGLGLITVLLGNGDGTFSTAQSYETKGEFSTSVAIADINLDGIPDLIVSSAYTNFSKNEEGRIDLFIGNGDGTFQPSKAYASGGNASEAVLAGDFNRDGKPDIAVVNACADLSCLQGSVSVLVNVFHLSTTTSLTSSLSPSFVGQPVRFTATISSTPTVPDGTPVTFTANGTLIGTGTTTSGIASITTSTLKAGTHPIKATFGGSAIFNPSNASVSQVTNKYSTITTIVSSLNPSSYGQAITWTATVKSSGPVVPSGIVKFGTLGSAKLIGGVATLTKSSLAVGTYAMTAQYLGDLSSMASSSAQLDQVINPAATTITITSSRNPSRQGQSVTFRVRVTSFTGAHPIGSVTFTAGGTVLGTVTLVSTAATISTSSLPTGAALVQATYNGDSQFQGSSVSLNQTVNP